MPMDQPNAGVLAMDQAVPSPEIRTTTRTASNIFICASTLRLNI